MACLHTRLSGWYQRHCFEWEEEVICSSSHMLLLLLLFLKKKKALWPRKEMDGMNDAWTAESIGRHQSIYTSRKEKMSTGQWLYSMDGVGKDHLEETINNAARKARMLAARNKRWGSMRIFLGVFQNPVCLQRMSSCSLLFPTNVESLLNLRERHCHPHLKTWLHSIGAYVLTFGHNGQPFGSAVSL